MKRILLLSGLLLSMSLSSQETNHVKRPDTSNMLEIASPEEASRPGNFIQRLQAGGINVRGNMTFISNNILNRSTTSNGPNRPYHGTNNNNSFNMQYIDIDGDPSTFSSSEATLNLPNCSRVVYAGLYWAGVYPYDNWTNFNPRGEEYRDIKFKLPSTGYINISATDNNREVVYNIGQPYICFKDVTALVQAEPNPNGIYQVGNVRATTGSGGGNAASAGWTMVVIYENDNESSKNISIFDGFANISSANPEENITYSGFTTIPTGPVNVEQIIGALEGDRSLFGDQYNILNKANAFVPVWDALNDATNFFNGNITFYGAHLGGRTPASTNTLGFDVDQLIIRNNSNSILGNNDTQATVQFTSSGDRYWPFLNAMSVEIVEPKIKLVKTIEDDMGNDIAGTAVGLGSELFYNLSFQSVGTDNAVDTEIIDRLPKNVDLIQADMVLPTGVTVANYEAPDLSNGFRGEITFDIDDSLVEIGDPAYEIKFKVQVVNDCSQLRDVCSNVIQNQAFANYSRDLSVTGDPNIDRIENEPSFAGIDPCNLGQVGTSNFLIDTSGCPAERDEVMCTGIPLTLSAGTGFDSYEWVNMNNPTVIIGTNQTLTVTTVGTYRVRKVVPPGVPAGCVTSFETINVTALAAATNPIAPFADQVLPTCASSPDDPLSEIYLCGVGSSREINLPFVTGSSHVVRWYKRDETVACTTATTGCPNIDTSCSWDQIGDEFSRTFSEPGEYRLEVDYGGRCPAEYYFNVYRATLNPNIIDEDLVCGQPAQITINNIPAGYEYSLTGPGGFNAPYQASNQFTVTAAGDYDLTIRATGGAGCEYTFPPINIQETGIDLDVMTGTMFCADDEIDINVHANGSVSGPYTYTLILNGAVVGTAGPTTSNTNTFTVTDGGNYTVRVQAPSCDVSENIVIIEPVPLNLTAVKTKDISCAGGASDGLIELTASGGTLNAGVDYAFAVITKDGVNVHDGSTSLDPATIPSTEYFTNTTFNVANGDEGVYRFIVVDSNNCTTLSEPITVGVEPELNFNHTSDDVSCFGATDGSINVTLNGANLGFNPIEYSIDGGTNWNTTGVFDNLAPNTYTVTIRASKINYQCNYTIDNIVINDALEIQATASQTRPYTCAQPARIEFTTPTNGTAPYEFSITNGTTWQTSPIFDTVVPGTYTLVVRDASNCTFTLPTTITVDDFPAPPTFTASQDANCDNTNLVTISPTNAAYQYVVNGGALTTDNSFNLPNGNHIITVHYGGGCTVDVPVAVTSTPAFGATLVGADNISCNSSADGRITINATNFTNGDYEVSIDGGANWVEVIDNPYSVVGLDIGTYNVMAREVTGTVSCEISLGDVTLTQPDPIVTSYNVTESLDCSGGAASVEVIVTGGTPPYEYSIDNGATWQTSNYFYNVASSATPYNIKVRDSKQCDECGCSSPPFQNGSFEDFNGSFNGRGWRPFRESDVVGWNTTDPQNRIELWRDRGVSNIPVQHGNVLAEINYNGNETLYQEYCSKEGDIISWSVWHRGRQGTDEASVNIGGDLTSIANTTNDEQARMRTGTSWRRYTGTYIVPAGQTTTLIAFKAISTASGRPSVGNLIDNIDIQITRAESCNPLTINLPTLPPIDASNTTLTPTACYDGTDGSIAITVDKRITTDTNAEDDARFQYQFSIDGGITWQDETSPNGYTFNSLLPGNYNILVKDNYGCDFTQAVSINDGLTALVTGNDETCTPGEIIATPSGGDGNYTYEVFTGGLPIAAGATPIRTETASPITNILAGTYSVRIIDGENCAVDQEVVINKIDDPTVTHTLTPANCDGDTATITVTIANGVAPYTYTVDGGAVQNITGNQQTITGLTNGMHTIQIRDANNCPANTINENITIPDPLVAGTDAVATDLLCNTTGGTDLGTITFNNPTGGTAPYTFYYELDTTGNFIAVVGTTVGNLPAGDYNTKVIDANGCELILNSVTIDDLPTVPNLDSGITYNCDGTGNITITDNLGAPLPNTYTYSLNGGAAQTSAVFNNQPVGTHVITVNYGSACTEDITVQVENDRAFEATIVASDNPVCFGETNGSITIEVSNSTGTIDYVVNGGTPVTGITPTANQFTINGLAHGNYTIEVTPTGTTLACTENLTHTLTQPAQVTVTASVTKEITCDITGAEVGATIEAVGANGVAPYNYVLLSGTTIVRNTGAGDTLTNIPVGNYTVRAIDANGCTTAIDVPVIVNPKQTIDFTLIPENCYDGTNGNIIVEIISGNGGYEFQINGGAWQALAQTSAAPEQYTVTGLNDGVHTINVRDVSLCEVDKQATINDELTAIVNTTPATCNNGEINITASGGDATYTYEVFNGGLPITGAALALPSATTFSVASGNYAIRVTDGLGCTYEEAVTVGQIVSPTITSTITQPNCNGDTGSITIDITNGVAPYTYTLNGGAAQNITGTQQLIANVNNGDVIIVTDANTCPSNTITVAGITVPTALAADAMVTATDLSCNATGGTNLGSIDFTNAVLAGTGTAPYTYYYELDTTGNFIAVVGTSVNNLPAGDYNTKVIDANGCEIPLNQVTINDLPPTPTFVATVTAYECDGTGTVEVMPFNATYGYSLNGAAAVTGAGANVFTGLAVGTHTITIDYGSNCTEDVSVLVEDDKGFDARIIDSTNPTCFDANDGTVIIEILNNTGNVDYEVTNASAPNITGTNVAPDAMNNTITITGLADGTNTINVDLNGTAIATCAVNLTLDLTEPAQVTVVPTIQKVITCDPVGGDIGATIQAVGGNGRAPYTYELFDSTDTSLGNTLTNIAAGDYTVQATDANGCKSVKEPITILPKADVEFFLFPETCYDGTDGTIEVDVDMPAGVRPVDYQVRVVRLGTPNTVIMDWHSIFTNTNVLTVPTSDFEEIVGLSDGTYEISVRNASLCVVTKTATINPEMSAFGTPTNISCNDGQIQVTATGGDGNYQYEYIKVLSAGVIDPGAPAIYPLITTSNTIAIPDGHEGLYQVVVRDQGGAGIPCRIRTDVIEVLKVPEIELTSVTPVQPQCNGDTGSVDGVITAATGESPFTIELRDNTGTVISTLTNHTLLNFSFNNIPAGVYDIRIVDSLGCDDIEPFTLVDPPALTADLQGILPACGTPFVGNENLFGFEFTNLPTLPAGYTIEFSKDSGATWQTSPVFTGINQGTRVYPVMRLLHTGTVTCIESLNSYRIPFDVSGLIVDPVVDPTNCTDGFEVTVQAIDGIGPFTFSINDPNGPFDPSDPASPWEHPDADFPVDNMGNPLIDINGNVVTADRTRTYENLIPGLSYVFYVRDANGCIEQNIEDLYAHFQPTVPITGVVDNESCAGMDNGSISFTYTNALGALSSTFTWTLFRRDDVTNVGVEVSTANGFANDYVGLPHTSFNDPKTDLGPGLYYVVITDGAGTGAGCQHGSADVEILPSVPISGDLTKLNDITCDTPGRVRIDNVVGGFPAATAPGYTYTITNVINATGLTITGGNIVEVAHANVTDTTQQVSFQIEVEDTNTPNSCTTTLGPITLDVSQPPSIFGTLLDVCNINNIIRVTGAGGTPPYRFSIDNGATYSPAVSVVAPATTASYSFQNVAEGVHTIRIIDANGCESTTTNVTVHPEVGFDIIATNIPTCSPGNDGEADIVVTSGSGNGNYEYELNGGARTPFTGNSVTLTNLAPGPNNIEIFDIVTNCRLRKPFTVPEPLEPNFTATVTNDNICNASNGGEITLSPVLNGTEPLTYTITDITAPITVIPESGTTTATDLVVANLPAGTYEIFAIAANGCRYPDLPAPDDVIRVTINENAAIVPTAPVATQFSCNAGTSTVNFASVTLPAGTTGGTGVYPRVRFEYTPASGAVEVQDNSTFTFNTSNTSGGTVTIEVFDSNGCSERAADVIINPFTEMNDVDVAVDADIRCNRNEVITATAQFTATSTTNLQYVLTDGTGTVVETVGPLALGPLGEAQFTNAGAGLTPDIYTITVTNLDTNCIIRKAHEVAARPNFEVIAYDVTNETCVVANDGTVTINFATTSDTYMGNYNYELFDAATNTAVAGTSVTNVNGEQTIINIPAGTYYVKVTLTATAIVGPPAIAACEVDTNQFTVTEAAADLVAGATVTSAISCVGASDATITASATDGWGNYTYQLEDNVGAIIGTYDFATNGANNVFTGLASGDYVVRVSDANNCEDTHPIRVDDPDPVNILNSTITNHNCDPAVGGSISIEAEGGSGTYQFSVDNGATFSAPVSIVAPATSVTYIATGLVPATYTIVVKDSNGCIMNAPGTLTILDGVDFDITATTIPTCTTPNGGQVEITVNTGSGNYEYELTNVTTSTTGVRTAFASPITGLTAADYSIEIFDTTTGCSLTKTFTIQDAITPSFNATITNNDICNGSATGEITIEAINNGVEPLTYTIIDNTAPITVIPESGTTTSTILVVSNLEAGSYTITAEGTNGCTTPPTTLTIDPLAPVALNAPIAITQFNCNTNSNAVNQAVIVVDETAITGGTGNYTNVTFEYDYFPIDGTIDETQSDNNFTFTTNGTVGGEVTITVSDDQGCSVSTTETIDTYVALTGVTVTQVNSIECNRLETIQANASFTPAIATPVLEFSILDNTGTVVKGPRADGNFDFTTGLLGLAEGVYTVRVTNTGTGCSIDEAYTVNPAPVYDAIAYDVTNETCVDADDGTVTINFSAASATYIGNYDYQVFDAATNTAVGAAVIGANGEVTIASLEDGTYYVELSLTATGATGAVCTTRTNEFTIEAAPNNLTVTANVTVNASCHDVADATIEATASDGWGNYTYQLEDNLGTIIAGYDFATNGNNSIFTGLIPGDYIVAVSDANNCIARSTVTTIDNPDEVDFTITHIDNVCDLTVGGQIDVVASGGSGTYTFILWEGTNEIVSQTLTATNFSFTNIPSGAYTVTVTDSNGCNEAAAEAVTIDEDLDFSVVQTKNIDCTVTPEGTVEVSLANFVAGTYEFEVNGLVTGNLVARQAVTASVFTFNPAVADTYTVTVYDTVATPNCNVTKDIIIQPAITPSFDVAATVNNICNGGATGEISITEFDRGIDPVTYTITPAHASIVYDATAMVFRNVPADTYTITATGANECTSIENIEIIENPVLDIAGALSVTPFNCLTANVTNNATVEVNLAAVTGGSGNYTTAEFVYDNNTPADTTDDIRQTGTNFSFIVANVLGGEVTVTVIDDGGCSATESITVDEFAVLEDLDIAVDKAVDCATGEDINVTLTSSIAIANLEYRLYEDGNTTALETRTTDGDFTFLMPSGDYIIQVENLDTGCIIEERHRVDETPEFTIIANNEQRTCFGMASGTVDISFDASTPYAGVYTYQVFIAGGTTTTGITGNGDATVTETIQNLGAGTYYVQISMPNTPFCSVNSNEFTIEAPAADLEILPANIDLTYVQCTPSDSGELIVEATGGWGNYQYELVNNTTGVTVQSFEANNTIVGLTAGDYTINVIDGANCTATANFTLDAPLPITATHSVTPNDCEGEFSASIEVTGTTGGQMQMGVTPVYNYTLIHPDGTRTASQTLNIFNGLAAGNGYSIIIEDGYSCSFTINNIDIADPTKVEATGVITEDITCNRAQATVLVTASGGTGPYEFSMDATSFVAGNVSATEHEFNVDGGDNKFYVRDINGCISEGTIVPVATYEALTATLNVESPVTCNTDANAALSAEVTGGFGNYEYQLINDTNTIIQDWQNSNLFGGIDVGTYKIRVRSTNRAGEVCTTDTDEITIIEPTPLGITETHRDVTCFGGNDGSITVIPTGGNGGDVITNYEYNIQINPEDIVAFPDDKFVDTNTFEDLAVGHYVITVKDKLGCYDFIDVIIEEPEELRAIAQPTANQQNCIGDAEATVDFEIDGGTLPYFLNINGTQVIDPVTGNPKEFNQNQITLSVSDGLIIGTTNIIEVTSGGAGCPPLLLQPVQLSVPVDLQVAIDLDCPGDIIKASVNDIYENDVEYVLLDENDNEVDRNNVGEFNGVAQGTGYYVRVIHNNGCDQITTDVDVVAPVDLTVDDSEKNKLIADGFDGVAPYQYSLDTNDNYGDDNEFLILQTRDYTIWVKDANGCEQQITVHGEYVSIFVPNLFTPNGDGKDDYWYPREVEDYHDIEVIIFDRYARQLKSFKGVQQGWDGIYNGKPLPSGDYWYTIYYRELSGQRKKLMGHFTLYRL